MKKHWKALSTSLAITCVAMTSLVSAGAATAPKKQYTIGVATQGLSHLFIQSLVNSMKSEASKLGNVKLRIMDSQDSVEHQLNQVNELISEKVDAIILDSDDYVGDGPAVEAAKRAHIPLVEVVTFTKDPNYTAFIGTNPVESGVMEANFIIQKLHGKGSVAIIQGQMGSSGELTRTQGLTEAFAKSKGIKVLTTQTANWNTADAMSLTEDWLQRFPKINAIAAENDDMAMGALQAMEAAKRTDIVLVGIDGTPQALQAVKAGKEAASFLDNPQLEGEKGVITALGLAQGKHFPKKQLIDYRQVTKANVSEFLK